MINKKSFKKSYGLAFLGFGFFLWGVYGLQQRFSGSSSKTLIPPLVEKEKDRAIIQNDKIFEQEAREAARRLAFYQEREPTDDPLLKLYVKQMMESDRPEIVNEGIDAAGAFNDESLILGQCHGIKDKLLGDELLLGACLKGLSRRTSTLRLELVRAAGSNLRPKNKYFWFVKEILLSAERGDEVFRELMVLVRTRSVAPQGSLEILKILARHRSENPEVKQLMVSVAKGTMAKAGLRHGSSSSEPALTPRELFPLEYLAFQFLAQIHHSELSEIWLKNLRDEIPERRHLALAFTAKACHPQRMESLREVLSRDKMRSDFDQVLEAFTELNEVGGALILESFVALGSLNDVEKQKINTVINKIKSQGNSRPEPCSQPL